MKTLIYLSGIASANLIMFGAIFRIFNLMGMDLLFISGVFIFCFFFLPASLWKSYKTGTNKKYPLIHLITFVVFFISMIAILFEVEHWPFGRIFLMISLPLPFVLFLPVYFYESKKDEKISSTFVPVMLGLMFIAVFSVLLSVR